jgi:hypothetical protein
MAGPLSLLLCEFATTHKDGTCSVVRGGIDKWTSALPVDLALVLFVQIDQNALSVGKQDGIVEIISPDGLPVKRIPFQLSMGNAEFPARFVVPMSGASLQSYGRWRIKVTISDLPPAELLLLIEETPTS